MEDRWGTKDALVSSLWVVAAAPWIFAWVVLLSIVRSVLAGSFSWPGGSLSVPNSLGWFLVGLLSTALVWFAGRWPKLRWGLLTALTVLAIGGLFVGVVNLTQAGGIGIRMGFGSTSGAQDLANALGTGVGLAAWYVTRLRSFAPPVEQALPADAPKVS